ADPGRVAAEDVLLFVNAAISAEPVGDGVDSIHVEYVFDDARWTQTFRSRELSKERFETCLAEAGLAVDRYLTDDGIWVRAVPVRVVP
ncbi:hypothetical protein ACWC5G_32635, partial [Streptomyces sp. NPDC001274]